MILLDEPSMGLAPQIVEEIFEIVRDLNRRESVSFLLAEQNTMVALRYADFGYILENGRVVMEGDADALADNEDVKEFYLGLSSAGTQILQGRKALPTPQTLAFVAGCSALRMAALSAGLFAGENGAGLRLALRGYFVNLGDRLRGQLQKTGEKQ